MENGIWAIIRDLSIRGHPRAKLPLFSCLVLFWVIVGAPTCKYFLSNFLNRN